MGLFFKKLKKDRLPTKLPNHIGIIMDGNGRWAKKKGMPRNFGHKIGAQVFKDITRYCSEIGIKNLTVFAFSTENWKRPEEEVNGIMNLLKSYMKEAISDFKDENIVVKFIGDMSVLSGDIKELASEIEDHSYNNDGMVLSIALNYGGRSEITNAAKRLVTDVLNGDIELDEISEEEISKRLYTANQPDVDLLIRTGGEYRISNFLLWQSAYAELFVMDVLWPDFKRKDVDNAIREFSNRTRRFGGV